MRQKLLLFMLTTVLAAANAFAGAALRATPERLSAYYPYALMSYLSELDLILSCDALEKQLFSIFRISYLGGRGIKMVVDEREIPANWQPHFTGVHRRNDHSTASSNSNCPSDNQLVGQIAMPDSGITARVFIQAADPVTGLPGRVVLAFSGEQPNAAFQCLLSEPQVAGPCASVKQHLQSVSGFVSDVKAEYPDHAIDVVGYSHSGALAQALMFASSFIDQAYIFNSYGVHPDWLDSEDDDGHQTRVHHAYIDGSFLHGQDYNPLSRYSRWRLPPHKVVGSAIVLSAKGLEPNLRQIYRVNHQDSWLDALYNLMTGIWVLHSKEAVLRTFEAHLGLDFPW